MRYPKHKLIATYSHTDEQVQFLVRFSLLTGCIVGGIITGALLHIFNG